MRQVEDVLEAVPGMAGQARGASPRSKASSADRGDDAFTLGPSTRTRRFVLTVAGVLIFVLVGMAQVWVRLRIVRMGYDLSAETRKAQKLQRLEHKLEVEQAVLRRPDRLKEAAKSRLGLREPGRGEVQEIRRGAVAGSGGF